MEKFIFIIIDHWRANIEITFVCKNTLCFDVTCIIMSLPPNHIWNNVNPHYMAIVITTLFSFVKFWSTHDCSSNYIEHLTYKFKKISKKKLRMINLNLLKEELIFFSQNYYDRIIVGIFSIGATLFFFSKAWNRSDINDRRARIPGRLGLPFLGETISFLSAADSAKGCYDFVRLRRLW